MHQPRPHVDVHVGWRWLATTCLMRQRDKRNRNLRRRICMHAWRFTLVRPRRAPPRERDIRHLRCTISNQLHFNDTHVVPRASAAPTRGRFTLVGGGSQRARCIKDTFEMVAVAFQRRTRGGPCVSCIHTWRVHVGWRWFATCPMHRRHIRHLSSCVSTKHTW